MEVRLGLCRERGRERRLQKERAETGPKIKREREKEGTATPLGGLPMPESRRGESEKMGDKIKGRKS